MRFIAEWADRALALFSPMKLTSSASFSPSIRISLRLKIHQAQAKNFCRGLDIRVPKIVKTNFAHPILLQNQRKMLCDIAGFHKLTDLIDIDITSVFFAIGSPAQFLIQLLLRFQTVQQFFKWWDKRQTAVAGLRLCPILLDDLAFAVYGRLRDGMSDGDGFLFEVDRIPFQANRFTPAQAVKCAKDDAKLYGVAFDDLKKAV